MEITQIRKRDGSMVTFTVEKIASAVAKAFSNTGEGTQADADEVAARVYEKTVSMCVQAGTAAADDVKAQMCKDGYPTVEEIQDLVEASLMEMDFFETAKEYIIYRAQRKRLRERDIFQKRVNLKPYEYPELAAYVDAVRH